MKRALTRVEGRISEGQAVLYEKDGSVAIVSLNRPQRLNAYSVAMRDALHAILLAVRDDPDVAVVILRGNGPAFGSGGDLSEFGTAPSPTAARAARWTRDVWGLLRSLPQITMAAVHGYVVGGGFEMAMLCDLCVAASSARFALPETGLGMIPGVAGTQTAPRLFGVGRALDLVLTGRWLEAQEALQLGIVNRVVPQSRLRRAALDLAQQICESPPLVAARLKRLVHEGFDLPLAAALELEQRMSARRTV